MGNKTSSKGEDGFINKAKKPLAFFRRFESVLPRGSSGKAIAVQAKDGHTANLCGLCSDLEKSLFCAFPTDPDASRPTTFSYHESLSDLVKSASDGCGLCKVFLYGVLHEQCFAMGLFGIPIIFHNGNMQEAQDTLLAEEAAKNSFLAKEHPQLLEAGLRPINEQNIMRRRMKSWYAFELSMSLKGFLVSGTEHENQWNAGFVTLKLGWMSGTAEFFITSEPGSAAHLEGHFYGKALSMYPDFQFVEDLIRECKVSHKCVIGQASDGQQMPTRLISIRDEGLDRVPSLKLVEGGEIHPYVALSHRWAKTIDCVTRLENIEERKTNLDYNILPQTFKDAILVSLVHGYTYLWIDCLCIVQDDSHDWERECPKMVDVYGNADFTIAAVTAPDSYAGFLGPRNNLNSSNSCMLRYWNSQKLPEGVLRIEYLNTPQNPLSPGSENVLDQRGWTLQERLLSNHVLSFSKDKMFWECDASYRLETLHFACASADDSWRVNGTTKQDLKAMERSKVYQWWYKTVNDYCKRSLTFPMDRLPAISGIAAMLQKLNSDIYLAGLWQNHISTGLAWGFFGTALEPNDIDRRYRAPSWSWARFEGSAHDELYHFASANGPVHQFVEFVSADIKLRGEDPYGQVEEGTRLIIRAPTKQGFIGRGMKKDNGEFEHHAEVVIRLPYSTTDMTALRVSIDDPKFLRQILDESLKMTEEWSEEYEGLQVTTMHLCCYKHYPPEWSDYSFFTSCSYGLALMPVGDGNTFRRIGLIETCLPTEWKSSTPIDDWFADAEMRELTLI